MLNVSEEMWDIWEAGRFVGDTRPVTRALISKRRLTKVGDSPWRSLLFAEEHETIEIPNILNVTIDRRLGSDAASMQMVILNQTGFTSQSYLDENELGDDSSPTKREQRQLGAPGIYTYRRGVVADENLTNPWGHEVFDIWVDMFIPNRVIYTFQGYGTDGSTFAQDDTRLGLTGIWLIDRVEFRSDATINIQARDLAKLLIEQRLYPPIIPKDKYPLELCAPHTITETVTHTETTTTTTGVPASKGPNVARHIGSGYDSSVAPWYGYNGSVYGHRASHVFDGDNSTYWLSVGNSGPTVGWAFEWIGANCRGEPINRVRFRQKWGGYRVYVGVKENGTWQGSATVPYASTSEPAYPNGSNIKYVKTLRTASGDAWIEVELPRDYDADEIRVVFHDLHDSNLGTYQYRAAVYELQAYYYQKSTVETVTETETTEEEIETLIGGNILDYTDIVKLFCLWAGFFWPNRNGPADILMETWWPALTPETHGKVWGDFFQSGAYPVEPPCIPPSYWDNKSLQDGINQIKEILGFIFYIDSAGGAVFRPPNIWKTGNFMQGVGYVGYDSVRTVHEDKVLIDYGVTIDDENLRSEIIAVSADDPSVYSIVRPKFSADELVPGTYGGLEISDRALLGGQKRPMLVPDYPFGTKDDPNAQAQVDKFTYLVSLWIHWSYRKSKFRIPGMPAFEPDDQVRIYERNTSEVYVHYLEGVRSVMDMEAGTWYMDVDTHWLGNGPSSEWLVNTKDMHPALFAYLRAIGQIPDEVENDESLWPDDWYNYEPPDFEPDYPRIEDDYSDIFPLPPGVEWPGNIDFESSDNYDDYVVPPSGGSAGGGGSYNPGTVVACSNEFMWKFWSPSGPPPGSSPSSGYTCNPTRITKYRFLRSSDHPAQSGDVYINVDNRGIPAWEVLAEVISQFDYNVLQSQTGAYDCRCVKILGKCGTKWSNHSWGVATDINWTLNPQGQRVNSGKIYSIGRAAEDLIRTNGGHRVFVWGNRWSTPDPMHFQICATPSQLSTGVKLIGGALQ